MKTRLGLCVLGMWMVASVAMGRGAPVLLDWGTVDTASVQQQAQSRTLRTSARAHSLQRKSSRGTVPWLVQFDGVIREEWKTALRAAGAKLHGYVPENAILVEATPQAMATIGALPSVSWVGEYLPAYKRAKPVRALLAKGIEETRDYNVVLFQPGDLAEIEKEIAKLPGASVNHRETMGDRAVIRAQLPASAVEVVTGWSEVVWVEPYLKPQLWSDMAVRTPRMNVSSAWTVLGLTGAGQTIAVCDTGLDTGNLATLHQDFTNRVTGFAWSNADYSANATWEDTFGHGTHVAGSVAGSGTMSGGSYKGVAFEAHLIVQGMGADLRGLPGDFKTVLAQAFTNGARIHSNSWGVPDYGGYGSDSRNLDMFVWSNKTMLVLVAAQNLGVDADSNGVIDDECFVSAGYGSVGSPGTAKNGLTVGAAENDRTTGGYSARTWSQGSWAPKYPADPIHSDLISSPSSPQGMAAFSSRGPCQDGRIKPDLVAPGTDVISARSRVSINTGWGRVTGNSNYVYWGGTSMATPLAAGAAGLARQWLMTAGGITNPSAALLKALLINGARNMAPGQYGTGATQEIPDVRPNNVQGFGHVDLFNTLQPATNQFLDLYDTYSLSTGQTNVFALTLDAACTNPFILTMAYSDYWAEYVAGTKLVNDLDLTVQKPSGGFLYPNGRADADATNNVEMVEFVPDEVGTYTVRVVGRSVPMGGSQDYALVVRGFKTGVAPVFDEIGEQQVTFGEPLVFTVGATGTPPPTVSLLGTTASGGYGFAAATGELSYTPPLVDAGAQTFTFTASNTAGVATQIVAVAVRKWIPTVTTPPTAATLTYGQTLGDSALSGGAASVPGTFAFTAPATIPSGGTSGQSVTFAPTDSVHYEAVAFDVSVTVDPASQTIDFPPIADQWSTNCVSLAATASSGLPVAFAVGAGPGSISGGTALTFTGTGTVSIVASQAGNGNWLPAADSNCVFHVTHPPLATVFSTTNVLVREAGEGRLYVRLNVAPGADVAVTVGRSSGDTNLAVASGAALTFTPLNWNAWQSVTLAAGADDNGVEEEAVFVASAPGLADQVVAARSLDDDAAENLAPGAALSGAGAYLLPALVDGFHTASTNYGYTVWTRTPPGYVTMDLQATASVARIRVLTYDWSFRSHQYRIESSLDGASWSNLVDASAGEHRGWEDWAVGDVPIRYLRLTGLSNSANSAVCIAEWEVYPPPPWLEFSTTNVNVREAGEGRVFVRMKDAPESNVVIGVSRSAGDAGLAVKGAASLTFTPADWNGWKPLTLGADADANDVDETATIRFSSPDRDDQFVTATALDGDVGQNFALESNGATITGAGGYLLPQAIDGVHTSSANYAFTVWTRVPPGSMSLDLQEVTTVSRVRLLTYDWSYRSHQYRIESSLDGASWAILVDASAGEHRGWEDWEIADQPARYLRFTGLSNSANSAVCLPEWEVYGTQGPPEPPLAFFATNVNVREAGEGRVFACLTRAPESNVVVDVSRHAGDSNLVVSSGATLTFTPSSWSGWQMVTLAANADENGADETATFQFLVPGVATQFVAATALDDDVGENLALASSGTSISGSGAYLLPAMIDGMHASSTNYGYTVWTRTPPGSVVLDLQATATVSRVRLLNWDWSCRVHQYLIEASLDGASWATVVDASAGGHRGWEDWPVASVSARYLRFTGLSNSANSAVCIPEWEVYGTRAGPAAAGALVPGDPGDAAVAPPAATDGDPEGTGAGLEIWPATVVTSDDGPEHTNGWAAVDGDPDSAWIGQQVGGGYIAVGYVPPVQVAALEVDLAAGSLTNLQCLYSQDAEEWLPLPPETASQPVLLNYLWLIFPDEGTAAVPRVLEIRPVP
jgi:hypothetical protein